MTEVISVKFKSGGKTYYFDPAGFEVSAGQRVIVDTANGTELVDCTEGNHEVEDKLVVQPLRPMLRPATEADERYMQDNPRREAEAFKICEKKIEEFGLDMKLVRVEYNFDGSKIIFFFTSDGRVDFRDLVKELAGVFKTRIILRQIGVRDEAKMIGGIGICGRPVCCASFLDDFQPVSIKMAKTQSLSLNPTKISGACGRLMCCLKYEQDAYEDAVRRAPKINAHIDTGAVQGTVTDVNLLRETIKVRVEGQQDEKLMTFKDGDIRPVEEPKEAENDLLLKYFSRFESDEKQAAREQGTADTEEKKSDSHRRKNHRKGGSGKGQNENRPASEQKAKPAPAESSEKSEQHEQKKRSNHRRGGKGHGQSAPKPENAQSPEKAAAKPLDGAASSEKKSSKPKPQSSKPAQQQKQGEQKPKQGEQKPKSEQSSSDAAAAAKKKKRYRYYKPKSSGKTE